MVFDGISVCVHVCTEPRLFLQNPFFCGSGVLIHDWELRLQQNTWQTTVVSHPPSALELAVVNVVLRSPHPLQPRLHASLSVSNTRHDELNGSKSAHHSSFFPFFFVFFYMSNAASFHTYPSAARKITCVVWSPTQALRSRWFCYLGPAPSASFPPVTRMQFLPCLNKKHCCVMLCTIYACQSAWYSSEYNATQSHMFVWKQPMILSAVWVWFISSFFFLFFFSFPVTHGERSIPALSLSLSPGPWTVSQIDDRGRTRAPRGTLRCGV